MKKPKIKMTLIEILVIVAIVCSVLAMAGGIFWAPRAVDREIKQSGGLRNIIVETGRDLRHIGEDIMKDGEKSRVEKIMEE